MNAVDGQVNGLVFYGLAGPLLLPWGASSSFLCVQPQLQRMSVLNAGGTPGACDGQFLIDWNQFVATHPGAAGVPFTAGQSVWAQCWFRDPPAPTQSALSDALWFDVCP